ncbi:hypothetical protein [Prosthecobacter sp.]|uniref:hypothetical protein n=1 Tax=Prosthecobacter sp. TaxID=1965333 RepID=UPI00378480F8
MQKEAALEALRTIDVKVYASQHQDLSPEQLARLRAACSTLIASVSDNPTAERKAATLVELVLAILEKPVLAASAYELILEQGVCLSLFIQQAPE